MTIGRSARILLSAFAVLLGRSAGAAAQSNDEIFPQFQWNFSTPGARANGMGRAFIGMADDATATISNPAGLVSLTKPQVYFEVKNTNLKVDRLAAADALTTLNPTAFSKDINALSFFGVSAPIGSRLAVGFTVHQFLNYQESFQLEPRPVPGSPVGSVFRPVNGTADFKGTTFGFTASSAILPKLNVGVTVASNRLQAESLAKRNDVLFSPTRDSGILANQTSINDTVTAASFSWGAQFKPNEKVSVGFEHVIGPRFKTEENLEFNPGNGVNLPVVQGTGFPVPVSIDVPDRLGFGLSLRPGARWVFAFDATRIQYSSLVKDFALIFGQATLNTNQYTIADVTEAHAGAEISLSAGRTPIFLRAGIFTNPNHAIEFHGASTVLTQDARDNELTQTAIYNLLERQTEVRGTVGAGFAFGQRMQLDFAYVIDSEFVVSAGIRFK